MSNMEVEEKIEPLKYFKIIFLILYALKLIHNSFNHLKVVSFRLILSTYFYDID